MRHKRNDSGPRLRLVPCHDLAGIAGGHVDPATGVDDGCSDEVLAPRNAPEGKARPAPPVVPQAPVTVEPRPILRCGTVVPAGYLHRVY